MTVRAGRARPLPPGLARWVALLAVVAGLAVPASAGAATSALRLGFTPTQEFSGADAGAWLDRARAESGSVVRVYASWGAVSPSRPTDDQASDPGWPGYRWTAVDAQVRATVAHGLQPLVMINDAPAWAQGADRPGGKTTAAWKPDAAAFGRFAGAVARRYSGSVADPAMPGATLPKATQFQLWNEPNLDLHLAPQWDGGKPFAPVRFRDLVNAGYVAVKAAQPSATVVTAGLAPFGDYGTRSGTRTPPVAFLRSMLCLDGRLERSCSATTRFDALSHHPYGVRKPSSPALNADDVTVPDLGKLTRVLRAARKAGTLGPTTPGLWVTEVSYDSDGPDPDGVPSTTLERWIPELLWRLWREGVGTVLWFQVRDQLPTPSFDSTYQSGMYLNDGTRKPFAQAFRFPVTVTGRTAKRLKVWLRSPVAGTAKVQVRRGGRWVTVARTGVRAAGVRTLTVPRPRVTGVRAVVGSETSSVAAAR
ncbi:hypothetical protein [Patulibacter americanus]|uniref:hypothetical protein n=1 Tax=Patulibacter americanus TaxID=588672 RepID=UPI0003B4F0A8|nr:hypothetical protein [Patulibacter americanus]